MLTPEAHRANRDLTRLYSLIVLRGASGPLFGFSDTWQLVINTGTTIVTAKVAEIERGAGIMLADCRARRSPVV